jgi:hypothetical protein
MSTDGDIQFEKIWEAIVNGTAPPPNQSTVVVSQTFIIAK